MFETNVDAVTTEPPKSLLDILPGVLPKLLELMLLEYPLHGDGRLLDEYVYDTLDRTFELNMLAAFDFETNVAIAYLQKFL